MDVLDKTLMRLEKEVWEILPTLDHPRLKELLADISSIKRTKEIVGVVAIPDRFPNKDGLTRGTAIYDILRRAPGQMHVKQIVTELATYGFDVSVHSAVGIMKKDQRNRFKAMGKSYFDLADRSASPSDLSLAEFRFQNQFQGISNGNGKSQGLIKSFHTIEELGMTIKKAIILILDGLDGEITQQDVYAKLVERFPQAAEKFRRTTVSVTLNKLAKDGVLDEVYEGYGRYPKRYIKLVWKDTAQV